MATAGMPALLATVGASSAALGLIEGLADDIATFSKLLSGSYCDRLRHRKSLAVVGYFLTAGGMASFAIATTWYHVLGGRIIGWFGRGIRTPVRKVLLAEATVPATYGRAFGLERAMDSAGAVIGPGARSSANAWSERIRRGSRVGEQGPRASHGDAPKPVPQFVG
jgi:MFS family permease